MRTHRNHLFAEPDLDRQLRGRQQQASSEVDAIPKAEFLESSDEEVLERVVPQMQVTPITLRLDARTFRQTETKVDISGDPSRPLVYGHRGPFMIPGTRADIDIPFTGDAWVFRYRTNPYSTIFPRGEIKGGTLRISVELPHDIEKEQFKEAYDHEIGLIKECVDRARTQIAGYNESLEALVREAVTNRRTRLGNHAGLADLFDIPP